MNTFLCDIKNAIRVFWEHNKPLTIALCAVVAVLALPIAVVVLAVYLVFILFGLLGKGIAALDHILNEATEKHPRTSRLLHAAIAVALTVFVMMKFFSFTFGDAKVNTKDLKSYQKATTSAHSGKELHGVDISAWQADTYQKFTAAADDFVIVRIAGGQNVDPYCDLIYQNAKNNGKLLGGYFYADAGTWTLFNPEEHAKWCAQTVEGYLGWTVFFLDVENGNNIVDTEWTERWLNAWYKETGIKACLYMNQDTAEGNPWTKSVISSTPLWVANYNGTPDLTEDWNVIAHQYTDTPVDSDTFYGTAEDWWKLCGQQK